MKKIVLYLLFVGVAYLARGQTAEPEVVTNAGDHMIGANAQVTWTLGETEIATYPSPNGLLSQGFNQPRLIINALEEPNALEGVEVFPVPFSNSLKLRLPEQLSRARVTLFDLSGKEVLPPRELSGNATHELDVQQLSVGTYFIRVLEPQTQAIQSFKVLKVQ